MAESFPVAAISTMTHFSPWIVSLLALVMPICIPAIGFAQQNAIAPSTETPKRPNILWITSEDNGPQLGCYGDSFATTPHLDQLASRGVRFTQCWSNAPVCAPARTTIITGMYPTSYGAQNMRSRGIRPAGSELLPELLRKAGYYCSNNSKEDYNFNIQKKPWDDSSNKAHWRNRPNGRPFFAVFNFTTTHESQIRKRPHKARHDASQVPIPPYHPDLPDVRRDWGQYYDKMEEMDSQVGALLSELKEHGLEDDTIVFYFGDHGSGMPRSKRWLYQSGLHVPMIVFVPPKYLGMLPESTYASGGTNDKLISFVDLAPTVLAFAQAPVPEWMPGESFFQSIDQRNYNIGYRDRMDERIDMSRAIRDHRFLYIRNFYPYRPQGTYLDYMFQTPTTVAWQKAYQQGELNAAQSFFWNPKPVEELYDLQTDPFQLHNLATQAQFDSKRIELRDRLMHWMIQNTDHGVIPESLYKEGELLDSWKWDDMVRAAFDASPSEKNVPDFQSANPVVRYWFVQKALASSSADSNTQLPESVLRAMDDDSAPVRIVAAEATLRFGPTSHQTKALQLLLSHANANSFGLLNAVAAMNALANQTPRVLPGLESLPTTLPAIEPVYLDYLKRLIEYLQSQTKE